MPDALSLQPGVVFHQRYRVVRCIKRGGMGAVFEVLDERTDTRRALKVMHPDAVDDDDLRGRFAQEVRVTGAIESDHVVRVSDGGVDEDSGTPFLVMELLRGSDLGALLQDAGRIAPRDAVSYLGQAALGLERAHAAGIVHRDLKPENLFLTRRDDGSPCVKVLDFGIAKIVARRTQSQARDTRTMGTPTYMAPEQIRGEGTIGPAADVYALGLIAYALLVGQDYWSEEVSRAGSMFSFFSRVVQGMPEPAAARAARTKDVTLSKAFDAWLARAAAPRPEDRFSGAGAAVAALADALAVDTPPGLSPRSDPTLRVVGDRGPVTQDLRETSPTGATTLPALVDTGVETGVDTVPASKWSHTATTVSPEPRTALSTTAPVITMEGALPAPPPPAIAEAAPLASAPPVRRPLPRLALGALGAAAVAAVVAWVALSGPAAPSTRPAAEPSVAPAAPAGDPPSAAPAPAPVPSPSSSGAAAQVPSARPDTAKPHPQTAHSAAPAKPRPESSSTSGLPGLY